MAKIANIAVRRPRFVQVHPMSVSRPSIIETRHDQILPQLDATDIERARRFGEVRRFAAGEALAAIGEIGIGLGIILSGQVEVYRYAAMASASAFTLSGRARSSANWRSSPAGRRSATP